MLSPEFPKLWPRYAERIIKDIKSGKFYSANQPNKIVLAEGSGNECSNGWIEFIVFGFNGEGKINYEIK